MGPQNVTSGCDPEILAVDEALAVGDEAFGAQSFQRVNEIREHAVTSCDGIHFTEQPEHVRGPRASGAVIITRYD
jgi:hypothetical protein